MIKKKCKKPRGADYCICLWHLFYFWQVRYISEANWNSQPEVTGGGFPTAVQDVSGADCLPVIPHEMREWWFVERRSVYVCSSTQQARFGRVRWMIIWMIPGCWQICGEMMWASLCVCWNVSLHPDPLRCSSSLELEMRSGRKQRGKWGNWS